MFGIFKRNKFKGIGDDELARLLVETFKRLKGYNTSAKLRVPYYLKIFLMKKGFDQKDLTDRKEDLIPNPKRDDTSTYVMGKDRSNQIVDYSKVVKFDHFRKEHCNSDNPKMDYKEVSAYVPK